MEPCMSRNCRAEQEAAACMTSVPEKVAKPKKIWRFLKQVFTCKSKETSNGAERGRCRDAAAGVLQGLDENPGPVKKKNTFKRFFKRAFLHKSKKTTPGAQKNNTEPQRYSEGEAEQIRDTESTSMYSSCLSSLSAMQEDKEDIPEAVQNSDTSVCSWCSCVSSLAAVQGVNEDIPCEELKVTSSHNLSIPETQSPVPSVSEGAEHRFVIGQHFLGDGDRKDPFRYNGKYRSVYWPHDSIIRCAKCRPNVTSVLAYSSGHCASNNFIFVHTEELHLMST